MGSCFVHDTLGTDVSVHDALAVAMVDGLEELFHDGLGVLLSIVAFAHLDQSVYEVASRAMFHDNEDGCVRLIGFKVRDDVGMVKGHDQGDLFTNPLELILYTFLFNALDGDHLSGV